MIYADIVKQSLTGLTPNKLSVRRRLYEEMRQGLKNALEENDPPVDGRDKVIELRLLETTIRRFETDIRAGIDVTADDYAPPELEAEQARLYALKVISRVPAPSDDAAAMPTDEKEFAAALSRQMRNLSFGAEPNGYRERTLRPAMLVGLLARFVVEMASTQGKLGLLWIFVEPVLLIGMTILIYLLLDQRYILNMDLIPFSILGVVGWMVVRVTAVKVAAVSWTGKDLIALPPIRIVSVAIGQASAQFLLYSVALIIGLVIAVTYGHGEFPEDWVRFFVYWVLLWVLGIAAGMNLALLFVMWKAAPRFVLIGTRFISWISGLFFVSEQFPSDMKAYIIWNPLLHGMQLLRSAYFSQYESEDASLTFLLYAIGILLILAAASERVVAPRVEPA